MNLLSLMMMGFARFDPLHDGYCWPVKNPKLKSLWDSTSTNGRESTEYLREVIAEAAERGIEVQLIMNWGGWTHKRITQGYPGATSQVDHEGNIEDDGGLLHCPDCPETWQAGLDEVADLLSFYDHPNVKADAFERLSYAGRGWCFCKHTQKRFMEETGKNMLEADESFITEWKIDRISAYLKEYVNYIKSLKEGIEVRLHTYCDPGWGHKPDRLPACGIDSLLPHTHLNRMDRKGYYDYLSYLAPNDCILLFDTRTKPPHNYTPGGKPFRVKTPEEIKDSMEWLEEYPGDNFVGLLFQNVNAVSDENKKAVYEQIKRFT